MPDNVDEDLIEATIRRVAEARAAREGAQDGKDGARDDPAAVPGESREDPPDSQPERSVEIERAAAVLDGDADHADAPTAAAPGPDEDAIAATIARVQAQKAAAEASSNAAAWRAPPDEDAIAATIRRVQAQKAAQELRYDDDGDDVPPASSIARSGGDAPLSLVEPIDDPTTFEPVSEVNASDDAIARLERGLRDAHHAIAGLHARIEALELGFEAPPRRPHIVALTGTDGEGAPRPLQPDFMQPQRPPPLDALPPQRAALAAHLPPPDAIDTRPLPEPLPPIHVESRRGLDLLPRTYRITVEDKRRGVDLVPLHRALLSMDGVRDMSLLSYNNGVAIVSLETTGDLDGDDLGHFVSRAMSRAAKVEQHNEHTFVVKLAEA